MSGVLHEPLGGPPPPGPPRPPPPGPRPPPGPPGPPKFGRGKAALRPSRTWSSLNEPAFSVSHSANHFSKADLSSPRVSEPSLSASAALKRPGATNPPGPPPRHGKTPFDLAPE